MTYRLFEGSVTDALYASPEAIPSDRTLLIRYTCVKKIGHAIFEVAAMLNKAEVECTKIDLDFRLTKTDSLGLGIRENSSRLFDSGSASSLEHTKLHGDLSLRNALKVSWLDR